MSKTISKIKEVLKINKPKWNEKYKVWVVRVRLRSGWKAVWRKQKEESMKVYEQLIQRLVKEETNQKPTAVTFEPNTDREVKEVTQTVKPNVLSRIWSKATHQKQEVENKEEEKDEEGYYSVSLEDIQNNK